MKLPREFIQLPFTLDTERLKSEVAALPGDAWCPHPTGFKGNSAVPLISVDGGINDYFAGPMKETQWLRRMPYVRQVLAKFGVVFGRSRLMALEAGAQVPPHSDVNYHWFTRARIHVPVVTFPEVEFHCGGRMIHMAEGEAWIFDNWRRHHVLNRSNQRRIHLVADTLGSSAFWSMVEQSLQRLEAGAEPDRTFIAFSPDLDPVVPVEKYNTPNVIAPSEVKELCEDLLHDLFDGVSQDQATEARNFARMVRGFYRDWAMLWTLHGDEESGWDAYEALRNRVLQDMVHFWKPLPLADPGHVAQRVLYARVLVACVRRPLPGVKTLQFAQ